MRVALGEISREWHGERQARTYDTEEHVSGFPAVLIVDPGTKGQRH